MTVQSPVPNPLTRDVSFRVQWLIVSCALLIFSGFIVQNIYAEHVRIDAEERAKLQTHAMIVDQNMSHQLDSINRALAGIRGDLAEWAKLADGDEHAVHHLKALVDAMPGVRTFLITDARGTVTASNREQLIGQNYQQREYFQAPLRNANPDTLYISAPYTTSLGVYSMSVSRAIIGADGRFAGVISATFAPAEFEVLMNSVRYAPDMWAFLAHGDGMVFMMVPAREKAAGTNLAQPDSFFTRHVAGKKISNVFSGVAYLTGEQRMIALRTVQPAALLMDKALVVAVSRDSSIIFAAWRHDASVQGGLFGALALGAVLGLFFYQRRRREYLAERERMDAALRETSEEWDRFFSMSIDLLCIADMQGHFRRLNQAWETTLGYPLSELEGAAFLDYVHPDDLDATQAALSNLSADKEVLRFVNRYRCKDGSYRWIEWQSKPYQETLIYAVARDVTAQRQAQIALRDSEEALNEAQRIAQVGSWELDLASAELTWSDEIFRLFEVDPNAFSATYEGFLNVIHPEDRDAVNLAYTRSLDTREPYEITHRLLMSDGRIKWVAERCRSFFDAEGNPIRSVGTVQDITERKLAEKEQDEMRRNQHALLNAIQESTFLMKKDGTMLLINDVGARRLNVESDDLVGKNIYEHLPANVAQSRREMFEQIAQSGKPAIMEDERAGLRFMSSIYPIFDARGKVARFAVYAADVTQQRRQQAIDEMLSAINQEILQGVSLHEVLTFICWQVAVLLQLEVVWLGRKEFGGAISVLGEAGSARNYVAHLKNNGVRWDDTPQGQGPAGSAIRSGQMQVFKVDDPRFQSWANIALENNLQSIISIPLVLRSEIYGAFTLYSSNPVLFDSSVLTSQLNNIGKHICIALEAAMDQQQIRLLSSALEAAGNGVIITNLQGKIQWANPAFSRLCGYSNEELLGETPRILKSGQQSTEYYQALWAAISNGENWSSETVERAKDGNLYTVSQSITPIVNEGELTHFIAIHEDISAQKMTQERIEHMAHYDALTGLPNRALFYDRLRQALSLARRNKSGFALMYMDLDGFKQVNDSMGHHAGDLLLIGVAERLSGCMRESDTVARLGGDEFTIILNETHMHDDVAGVAQKIIKAISVPFDLEGREARIGISIGIARYSEEASNEDELMKRADEAMYEAKSAGKNTYRMGSHERQ